MDPEFMLSQNIWSHNQMCSAHKGCQDLREINVLFFDGFLWLIVLMSGAAQEAAGPHGLYFTFMLFQQPNPLAGAYFHTSILAHHLSTTIQVLLQVGNKD